SLQIVYGLEAPEPSQVALGSPFGQRQMRLLWQVGIPRCRQTSQLETPFADGLLELRGPIVQETLKPLPHVQCFVVSPVHPNAQRSSPDRYSTTPQSTADQH